MNIGISIQVLFVTIMITQFLPETVFLEPFNFLREHVVPLGLLTPQICLCDFIEMYILLHRFSVFAAVMNNSEIATVHDSCTTVIHNFYCYNAS